MIVLEAALRRRASERGEMRIEEERLDVMQNLEFAVAGAYQRNPTMTDYAMSRY